METNNIPPEFMLLKRKAQHFMILSFSFLLLFTGCKKNQNNQTNLQTENMNIQANLVFFYYKDLSSAQRFYEDILGLRLVADYGLGAKIYQISTSSYIGLVDEKEGMHNTQEPKTVTLSFITKELDEWYYYLRDKGVKMHSPLKDATRHPTRGFVAYDPEGYYLEFELFREAEQNQGIIKHLEKIEAIYPLQDQITSRPKELGLQANIIWLYYKNLEDAQHFYENFLRLDLLLDQGFAKVYGSSPTSFIGLVDETQGLHRFSEEKSVTLAFLTEHVDEWYQFLKDKGAKFRRPLSDSKDIEQHPTRIFMTFDSGEYFVEFVKFLDHEINEEILKLLRKKS